jgi:poly-gamma-glutamate capsule biosynthesis protein CapA/YwtB (metallophosphatase superfamily)
MPKDVLLGFVGDVFVDRDAPETAFDTVAPELNQFDLLVGNLEGVYAGEGHFAPSAALPLYADPSNVTAFRSAGFSVLSLANNHIVDCGHEAMLATRRLVEDQGIAACGAGANLDEARMPAMADASGYKVAVLAYASVFPYGYEARLNWPGLAPLRARTHFEQAVANHWLPGSMPIIRTEEFAEDVDALKEDVARAKRVADIVIASFHWGDWTRPLVITDHERRVARVAIDAGADVVVGHHHHALRGIEWYASKPIFYGLGHFVFDLPTLAERAHRLLGTPLTHGDEMTNESEPQAAGEVVYSIAPRSGWPYLPMHPDMRLTMIAWCMIRNGRPERIGVVPCRLAPDGCVHAFDPDSPDGVEVINLLRRACEAESLPVLLKRETDIRIGRFRSVAVGPMDESGQR